MKIKFEVDFFTGKPVSKIIGVIACAGPKEYIHVTSKGIELGDGIKKPQPKKFLKTKFNYGFVGRLVLGSGENKSIARLYLYEDGLHIFAEKTTAIHLIKKETGNISFFTGKPKGGSDVKKTT